MTTYHDFEITLLDVEPRTWRRFLVKKTARATLVTLHAAIQDAAGWQHAHLHAFHTPDGEPFANEMADDYDDTDVPLTSKKKLAAVFPGKGAGERLLYNYDFGDDWWVDVVHHGLVERAGGDQRLLLDGAGLWAPDDCGGVSGFARLQNVLLRRAEGERLTNDDQEFLAWAGDSATAFGLEALRRRFHLNRTGTYRSVD